MTFGLTAAGFVPKSESEILSDIEAANRANVSATLDQSPGTVVGELNRAFAAQLAELWQLGADVYTARDPRQAAGAALDALCALTGTLRTGSTRGQVSLRCTLAVGATLPVGSTAQVTGRAANRWRTLESVTNDTAATKDYDVAAEAVSPGPLPAAASTIVTIATPVTGWLAVTNPLDAAMGRLAEKDAELAARRETELSRPGTATLPAIRADLEALTNANSDRIVSGVLVEENASAFRDSYGRPPHCIEAIVQFTPGLSGTPLDDARQRLAAQLFASVGAGADYYGDHSATVLTPSGDPFIVQWSEPVAVPVHCRIALVTDPATYAGDDAVRTAVLAYGATLALGDDVVRSRLICDVLDVAGVLDIAVLDLGRDAFSMHAANVTIGRREVAAFDTSRITFE